MSIRAFVRGSVAVVSLSTFVLLYFGLVDLARLAGMRDARAFLYPLAIDGMVAAAYASTLTPALSQGGRRFAWVVVAAGSVLSFAGQWLHAVASSGWTFAGPVAAAPAVSLALVWHLLFLVLRDSQEDTVSAPEGVTEAPVTVAATVAPDRAPEALSVAPVAPRVVVAAAVTPRAVLSSPARPSDRRKVARKSVDILAAAVAATVKADSEGRTLSGRDMARLLALPNAETDSGKRTGQRWVRRAYEARS